MEEREVYTHEGRKYVRSGQCNRCGQCCTDFIEPCLYLQRSGPEATCLVWHQPPEEMTGCACNPHGTWDFPDGPQALWWDSGKFNSCGYYFVEVERILVACPTYSGKDYCKERYLTAYENLDWPAKELLMVDTTDYPGNGNEKIAWGMEEIRQVFLAGPYDRWLNLEADVIVPPETIKVLLSYDRDKRIDWISHWYPDRVTQVQNTCGFGCTMFSRKLLERHGFVDAPSDTTTDGWFWHQNVATDIEMKCIDIWGVLQLEHLNG